MSRYTVWSVGRDGNVVDLFRRDSPLEAVHLKELAESWYAVTKKVRTVGIWDNESPESGDVSDKLAEKMAEEGK